ncbi:30S ribosomal protein S9 [bacterium]|nr:30S ribosomal protein S9 [bacterium]
MVKNTIQKTGKRKTSVARASLVKGKGLIFINNQKIEEYFNNTISILKVKEPLIISGLIDKFDIKVNVSGGGISSQADATRQAIARALIEITNSDDLKKKFIEYDRSLIVSDTRFKEMKKPNNSHARAKRQKSYR